MRREIYRLSKPSGSIKKPKIASPRPCGGKRALKGFSFAAAARSGKRSANFGVAFQVAERSAKPAAAHMPALGHLCGISVERLVALARPTDRSRIPRIYPFGHGGRRLEVIFRGWRIG